MYLQHSLVSFEKKIHKIGKQVWIKDLRYPFMEQPLSSEGELYRELNAPSSPLTSIQPNERAKPKLLSYPS